MKYNIVTPNKEILGQCEDVKEGVIVYRGFRWDLEEFKRLGLTLEEIKPVERKLYAYQYGDSIGFFIDETITRLWHRREDLDITYPVVTP